MFGAPILAQSVRHTWRTSYVTATPGRCASIFRPSQEDSWRFANFPGIVPSIGIMAFAFMCHHNTFLIYESIERATQQKWDVVTHWSLFTSFLIAAAFGIIGYATFTAYVQGDLMENYCWDDDLMNFARVMFSGTILLTFPIECFVTREVSLPRFPLLSSGP